jgi:hypothetical protein
MSVRLWADAEAAAAEQIAVHGDERTAAVGVEAAAAEQDVVHGSERAAGVGAVPSVRPTELRASWTTSVTSSDTAVGHPPQRQGHAGDGRNRQDPEQGSSVSLLRPRSFDSRDSLGAEGNASRTN